MITADESEERLSVEEHKSADFESSRCNSSTPKLTLKDSIPQIVASCAIYLPVIHSGINLSFSSILIPQLSAPESDIKIDLDGSSTVASIVTLTTALGALLCGPLMDKYGRK
jgi:MFS family permease